MKKVFHFDAPREKYHCDAAVECDRRVTRSTDLKRG
jgi:hypothetical protein